MSNEKRDQLKALIWCLAAFLAGCSVFCFGGCAASNTIKTRAFGEQFELGAGVYLNEDLDQ